MKSSQMKITDTFSQSKRINSPKSDKAIKRKSPIDENNCVRELNFETGFKAARKALHTSKPSELVGRESQMFIVYEFLKNCLSQKIAGSMYISGAPGTGKTAVVEHVVDKLINPQNYGPSLEMYDFSYGYINCMTVKNPSHIYENVVTQLKTKTQGATHKDKLYKRIMAKSGKMIVLVLDEMDQLLQGRSNETLYSLFDWARQADSKLILIGIANALDLTVRQLPLLISSPSPNAARNRRRVTPASKKKIVIKLTPESTKLVQFPPYERSEIEQILERRLSEIGSELFDPSAIKFAAAKVAASTGDVRKAINALKMALEQAEKKDKHSYALKSSDDGFNSSSPKKLRGEKVGVAALSKVMCVQKDDDPLPLQQMIILSTLLRIHKNAPNIRQPFDGVSTPVPISSLYDEYRKVCSERGFSWIDRSEISSVCSMLQDRSHVTVIEGGPSSGTFKKTVKKQTGILFDPKLTENLFKNNDLKTLVD